MLPYVLHCTESYAFLQLLCSLYEIIRTLRNCVTIRYSTVVEFLLIFFTGKKECQQNAIIDTQNANTYIMYSTVSRLVIECSPECQQNPNGAPPLPYHTLPELECGTLYKLFKSFTQTKYLFARHQRESTFLFSSHSQQIIPVGTYELNKRT